MTIDVSALNAKSNANQVGIFIQYCPFSKSFHSFLQLLSFIKLKGALYQCGQYGALGTPLGTVIYFAE
jgi:hypothetical protein